MALLGKQTQELYIDVPLLSQAHPKQNERFFIPNYHIYRTDGFPERRGGTAIEVRKAFATTVQTCLSLFQKKSHGSAY
jgi:hypothetical protein